MPTRRTPFNQLFDVVILGSGHAGLAASLALRTRGQSVLLIGPRGDLVWESGRGFWPEAGTCDDPHWGGLRDAVAERGGVGDWWMDGAMTEIVATDLLMASGASVLYYAMPVAVERENGSVAALIVATKSGLRRVAGRQWIDATESGDLLRLTSGPLSLGERVPTAAAAHLYLQHADWSQVNCNGVELRPTAWPSERVMRVDVTPGDAAWREGVLHGLERLAAAVGGEVANVSMSHLSIEPVCVYDGDAKPHAVGADNVVSASPAWVGGAVRTLADRFMLGVRAAAALSQCGLHELSQAVLAKPLPRVAAGRAVQADVCVAGAGTGGALAALAAAKAGATVVCVEPLAFVGGIGTGGGIHSYYWGVAGGLQQIVDERTRDLMKRYAGGPLGDGPFNPWAKMIALEQLLREHGVDLHTGAMLFDVEREGGRVTAAHVATERGVVRVEAKAYVDGTGDGDLCAMAGADFTLGREHDGLPHAYSQSSGRLREQHGRPRMQMVNFDAGWCDPTDPVDLTRARLVAVRQYLLHQYDNFSRTTYIAPAIGLRQARQVVTEHVLTLDDQIQRRRFDDPIGYTGCHYDNHAVDYEFESDQALFWVWANRRWRFPFACEMSYRMIVPRGVSNVWIASRCLGVSQDAHHSCRMQRDLQRAGEAAGFAAATAVACGTDALQLPYARLRERLDETGALAKRPRGLEPLFNHDMAADELETPDVLRAAEKALAALDSGNPGQACWWLYRHEAHVGEAVRQRLSSTQPMTSWLAACIVAMWGDAAAEPRLLRAITTREYGFGEGWDTYELTGHNRNWDGSEPLKWNRVVGNWLCAAALLRCCGTQACVPVLADLARTRPLALNTATTLALTIERLARRGVGIEEAPAILDDLLDAPLHGTVDAPQRGAGAQAELALRNELPDAKPVTPGRSIGANTRDDFTWQLHLAVGRARAALQLPLHDAGRAYLDDERSLVRRAFAGLMQGVETSASSATRRGGFAVTASREGGSPRE